MPGVEVIASKSMKRRSMSETKAGDSNLILTALDTIQATQEEHTTILTHLEARKIVDLAGIERRLDEVADAVVRLKMPPPRCRPWWLTPALMTLAMLGGIGLLLLAIKLKGDLLTSSTTRASPAAALPVPRKGK
jgi:hypothetical protein